MTTSKTTSDDDDEHHRAAGVGTVMLAVPSKKVLLRFALSFVVERCDNMCVLDWKEAPSPFLCDVFSRNVFLSLSLSLSATTTTTTTTRALTKEANTTLSLSLSHTFFNA